MTQRLYRFALLPVALSAALTGCAGSPGENRTLQSIHRPEVVRESFTLDLATGAGGLVPGEAQRLTDWLVALDARYGDRIAVTDGSALVEVAAVAAQKGLGIDAVPAGDRPGARVTLTRMAIAVATCPDWTDSSSSNPGNATSRNFGCAHNGNLARMVANPADLVRGATAALEDGTSAGKAVRTYRDRALTGAGGLKQTSTTSGD